MARPVNVPLGFLQAATSTNISIITEKPTDCQAQSPDVADNMFELLVVKVSRCFSNADKKAALPFPVILSTTSCSLYTDSGKIHSPSRQQIKPVD